MRLIMYRDLSDVFLDLDEIRFAEWHPDTGTLEIMWAGTDLRPLYLDGDDARFVWEAIETDGRMTAFVNARSKKDGKDG